MTFQAYIDNIQEKTGKLPEDFMVEMRDAGVLAPDMKAGTLVDWLAANYDLGRGHSMAIWAVFKDKSWVQAKG